LGVASEIGYLFSVSSENRDDHRLVHLLLYYYNWSYTLQCDEQTTTKTLHIILYPE